MKIIALCSGEGSRLQPITRKYPKSLIPIYGEPAIKRTLDTILSTSLRPKISEIIIVAKSEYFRRQDYIEVNNYIVDKYGIPITKKVNEDTINNNWYTMKVALEDLTLGRGEGVLVIEGDILIDDTASRFSDIFENTLEDLETSAYFCSRRDNEWVVLTDSRGKPYVSKATNGLAMAGMSYVAPCDVPRLRLQLNRTACLPSSFWDEVFIRNTSKLRVVNTLNTLSDFDTVEDLIKKSGMTRSQVASLISDTPTEVVDLNSMTNHNFLLPIGGETCVLRLPGEGTDTFVDRYRERRIHHLIKDKDITIPFEMYNNGVKITKYINGRTSTPEDVAVTYQLLSRLHNIEIPRVMDSIQDIVVNLLDEVEAYEGLYNEFDYPDNFKEVGIFYKKFISDHQHEDIVICHRDLDPRNVIISEKGDKDYLLDLEYSGVLNRYWDLGCYISELKLFYDENDFKEDFEEKYSKAQSQYEESCGIKLDSSKIELWSGVVDYVWSCWTIAKKALGEDFGDYFDRRWESACKVYEKYRDMI